MRTQKRKERAQRQRVPLGQAVRHDQKWSMDFVAQRLPDRRWIRVLTVVDQFTTRAPDAVCRQRPQRREGGTALDKIVVLRSTPESITVDNGTEFASKAMDLWAYKNGVIDSYRLLAAHAVGVSCGSLWMDKLASPGRTAARY